MEEKPNPLRQGLMRLPPGFRFHPTDEELVVHYLRRKALSCPLPASVIPEIKLFAFDPWDLPDGFGMLFIIFYFLVLGGLEEERYFFCEREAKYRNRSRSNRVTASGYWKATGRDRKVVASRGDHVVGTKKSLVFYRGKGPNASRTEWIMHEYRLATYASKMNIEDNWVLCRVFLKKRSTRCDGENAQRIVWNRVINFASRDGVGSDSHSESSCVTAELSSPDSSDGDSGSSS
ncbi:NAC transcription factor NAM-B2 [Acorus gramineus]|uniref:NAC transcription factor NAM-B2 n=1 Tax=Acorus gramineus TaxID=55184 RepID=A0AAV9A5W8_ACOGR|nr:NAC transcription factor NAM-B2 [Acorus gramineus]